MASQTTATTASDGSLTPTQLIDRQPFGLLEGPGSAYDSLLRSNPPSSQVSSLVLLNTPERLRAPEEEEEWEVLEQLEVPDSQGESSQQSTSSAPAPEPPSTPKKDPSSYS